MKFFLLSIFYKNNPSKLLKKMGVNIGNNVRFIIYPYFWNYPKIGSEPFLISIGDNSLISFNVSFITHDGSCNTVRQMNERYRKVRKFGKISIGKNCFIGCNTTIMPNVVIGNNCIVGANSVVTKDIPTGEVWAGNPARFIKTLEEYSEEMLKQTPQYDNNQLEKNYKEEILKSFFSESGDAK